jgi:hypothetical protein
MFLLVFVKLLILGFTKLEFLEYSISFLFEFRV